MEASPARIIEQRHEKSVHATHRDAGATLVRRAPRSIAVAIDVNRARRCALTVALEKLPGWVVDDATSVREQVAPHVNATVEQLWAARASSIEERVHARVARWDDIVARFGASVAP